MTPLRCSECGRLLGYVEGKASLKCPRCGAVMSREEIIEYKDRLEQPAYKSKPKKEVL